MGFLFLPIEKMWNAHSASPLPCCPYGTARTRNDDEEHGLCWPTQKRSRLVVLSRQTAGTNSAVDGRGDVRVVHALCMVDEIEGGQQ